MCNIYITTGKDSPLSSAYLVTLLGRILLSQCDSAMLLTLPVFWNSPLSAHQLAVQ